MDSKESRWSKMARNDEGTFSFLELVGLEKCPFTFQRQVYFLVSVVPLKWVVTNWPNEAHSVSVHAHWWVCMHTRECSPKMGHAGERSWNWPLILTVLRLPKNVPAAERWTGISQVRQVLEMRKPSSLLAILLHRLSLESIKIIS